MGGLAFAAAAALDGWLTQTATDPTVIAVHLAIATVDVILLAVFLRRASITHGRSPTG